MRANDGIGQNRGERAVREKFTRERLGGGGGGVVVIVIFGGGGGVVGPSGAGSGCGLGFQPGVAQPPLGFLRTKFPGRWLSITAFTEG